MLPPIKEVIGNDNQPYSIRPSHVMTNNEKAPEVLKMLMGDKLEKFIDQKVRDSIKENSRTTMERISAAHTGKSESLPEPANEDSYAIAEKPEITNTHRPSSLVSMMTHNRPSNDNESPILKETNEDEKYIVSQLQPLVSSIDRNTLKIYEQTREINDKLSRWFEDADVRRYEESNNRYEDKIGSGGGGSSGSSGSVSFSQPDKDKKPKSPNWFDKAVSISKGVGKSIAGAVLSTGGDYLEKWGIAEGGRAKQPPTSSVATTSRGIEATGPQRTESSPADKKAPDYVAPFGIRAEDVGKGVSDEFGVVITSATRNAGQKVGKAHNKSKHNTSRAIDIRPKSGVDPQDIKQYLIDSGGKNVVFIDETKPEVMKKTGATGPHWHFQWDSFNPSSKIQTAENKPVIKPSAKKGTAVNLASAKIKIAETKPKPVVVDSPVTVTPQSSPTKTAQASPQKPPSARRANVTWDALMMYWA